MSNFLDLLLRSVPIILGAGTVQLGIFLLKRPSELRALDAATVRTGAESGAVVVSSAERSLALSDQVRDNAVKRADEANKRADSLEVDLGVQRERVRQLTTRLVTVELEVEDLRAQVAILRAAV